VPLPYSADGGAWGDGVEPQALGPYITAEFLSQQHASASIQLVNKLVSTSATSPETTANILAALTAAKAALWQLNIVRHAPLAGGRPTDHA
jgi:hypothetical protein